MFWKKFLTHLTYVLSGHFWSLGIKIIQPPKEKIPDETFGFVCEQIAILESFYIKNKNPKPDRRKNIAKELFEKSKNIGEVTEEQVANWFKCRRKKDKEGNKNEVSYDALIQGFESLKIAIPDNQIIIRILTLLRKHKIQDNQSVMQLARQSSMTSLNHNFVDELETSLDENEGEGAEVEMQSEEIDDGN